ncbi:MAG: homoserine kinase [Nocardioides sp.]|nr:homoserine kinase [Nocardioides sp.]
MSALVAGPVRVSVPATSANLGPGFDCLGLALDLRDRLEAEVLDRGLVVEVSGQGAAAVPRDERHLVVRSLRAGLRALGIEAPGLRVSCTNVLPHSRGLGSSSAAIVGGLALARALVDHGAQRWDDAALFALAAELEGHPDNVAPAALGGFVISGRDADGGFFAVPAGLDRELSVVVLVPPDGLSTQAARGLLPAQVPHADAAANASRAALLVAALGGAPERLLLATEDRLHQRYREPAMPRSLALVDALRADGVPAVVSGAGPTVLALVHAVRGPRASDVLVRCPQGWSAEHLAVSPDGVRVEP